MHCITNTQRSEILGSGLGGPGTDLPRVKQLIGKRQVQASDRQAGAAPSGPLSTVAQPLTSCMPFDQVTSLSLSLLIWKVG